MQKSRTHDESYIVKLHEVVTAIGDLFHEVDCYDIGNRIGMSPKKVETIVNTLARANFVKKRNASGICLTENGERLVLNILEQ